MPGCDTRAPSYRMCEFTTSFCLFQIKSEKNFCSVFVPPFRYKFAAWLSKTFVMKEICASTLLFFCLMEVGFACIVHVGTSRCEDG